MFQRVHIFRLVGLLAAGSAVGSHAALLQQISVARSDDATRVEFRFNEAPSVEHFVLGSPPRAVIDMADTDNDAKASGVSGPRVRGVRLAEHADGRLRAVLDLSGRAYWAGMKRADSRTLVARIKVRGTSNASAHTAASTNDSADPRRATRTATYSVVPRRAPAVVVIDPGHGGHDPGTRGPNGLREKTVTLAIGRRVAIKLDAQPHINAVLTRSDDRYLSLPKRRQITQKRRANLFISIHANAYPRNRSVDGGSCYVLSKHGATNAKARQLAHFENNSDPTIAGVNFSADNQTLNAVLTDLFQNDSINAADNLANAIIAEFDKVEPLYHGKPLRANFAVLRDPMVPSVLCETAFLSNPRQARKLRTKRFRNKLAAAIAQGVISYFDRYPPMQKRAGGAGPYVVRRGDTLSGIAARRHTTVARLVAANSLDNPTLRVGQRLLVPSATTAAAPPVESTRYTVEPGDTLSAIAASHGTTVKRLEQQNELASERLQVGQTIAVPASAERQRIVVDAGDTLSQIASHNGTSVERLKRVNGLSSSRLTQGQVLVLPADGTRSS